ncbi:hypothetical protein FGB62_78g02 [Gracilaria domingensis]|nr:hypothetical protein FGB62_78g02 [Gracilaria domingensis]
MPKTTTRLAIRPKTKCNHHCFSKLSQIPLVTTDGLGVEHQKRWREAMNTAAAQHERQWVRLSAAGCEPLCAAWRGCARLCDAFSWLRAARVRNFELALCAALSWPCAAPCGSSGSSVLRHLRAVRRLDDRCQRRRVKLAMRETSAMVFCCRASKDAEIRSDRENKVEKREEQRIAAQSDAAC